MTEANIHARTQIGRQWPKLSIDEQQQLRSLWARSGVSCEICGLVGYYREVCPKQCQVPKKRRKMFDSDSDSSESDGANREAGTGTGTPAGVSTATNQANTTGQSNGHSRGYVNDTGLGVLWGNVGTLASSSSSSSSMVAKRPKKVTGSTLTHKQQYLAGELTDT